MIRLKVIKNLKTTLPKQQSKQYVLKSQDGKKNKKKNVSSGAGRRASLAPAAGRLRGPAGAMR